MAWLPIKYFEFYDVPRLFWVEWCGSIVIFDCPFSDKLDEYCSCYSIYRVWDGKLFENQPDWALLLGTEKPCTTIPVSSVVFDGSRRLAIDDTVLYEVFDCRDLKVVKT